MDKKEKIKYFSQFGQDKWIIDDIFEYKKNGYFVELAAGNGKYLSNTYLLENNLNWDGLCIEANDKLFKELQINRKCKCINACIDSKRKKVKFTADKDVMGGIIDKDTDNNKLLATNNYIYKETVPLINIFKKYNVPRVIDYFSLDVEGAESRVLKDFPFQKHIFLAINIERPKPDLLDLLKKNGYIKVGSNPCDKYFIHQDFNELNK